MSIDSCQTKGQQCIAFPQREKESKERSTLRRAERSQIKRTERRPEGGRRIWGFLHFWDSFGSISSRKLHHPWKRQYLGNRAKRWNNSQILFTAGMQEGLRSNVHAVKQQYWPYVVSAQSQDEIIPAASPSKCPVYSFNPVKQSLETLAF